MVGNTVKANTLLTPSIIANEALAMLEKSLVMEHMRDAKLDYDYYEGDQWGEDTIKIRRVEK